MEAHATLLSERFQSLAYFSQSGLQQAARVRTDDYGSTIGGICETIVSDVPLLTNEQCSSGLLSVI